MLKLWRILTIGHDHKWMVVEKGTYRSQMTHGAHQETRFWVMQCEKCGCMKNHKLGIDDIFG